MPIRSEDRAIISSPGVGEVRPEELTELVERLHRQQERLSVGDVAETLGVAPEAVEATLRAMRSERVPPVAIPAERRRPRRFRYAALAAGTLLIGGVIFSIGHDSGMTRERRSRSFGLTSTSRATLAGDLSQRLRAALPAGATLSVGGVSYTGAPGTVFADESELTPLIEELMVREAREERGDVDGAGASSDLIRRVSDGDATATGSGLVVWEPFSVTMRGQAYAGRWPRRTKASGPNSLLDDALSGTRHQAAVRAANRLNEWAAAPSTDR